MTKRDEVAIAELGGPKSSIFVEHGKADLASLQDFIYHKMPNDKVVTHVNDVRLDPANKDRQIRRRECISSSRRPRKTTVVKLV